MRNTQCAFNGRVHARLFVFVLVLGTSAVYASPPPVLIPMWDAHDAANTKAMDHSIWEEMLETYVNDQHPSGINRFDYSSLKSSTNDLEKLKGYLLTQSNIDPRMFSRDVQLAYWINLYNALTIWVVTNDFPVDSIRDIKSGILTFGPWEKELITVAGESLTLDKIEHGILRPIWQDPRIHYAVNCASLGCPNLAKRVYRADNLEELLEQSAKDYVNHPRGARIVDGELHVSSIYEWFQIDFGGNVAGVVAHLRRYAKPELAKALARFDDFKDEYDWTLNAP